ncbi:nitroreductase family protein [Rhodosalinus sp. FB01]|uniref:nitroreductase family protein n=1 Tax=Rhodosalinus sp. FB01 TaxID=3239194 RepID=UPI003524779C
MFRKGEVRYEPLPLPDRREMDDARMIAAARAVHEEMRTRHSVRDFSDRPVPGEVIAECVRTAGTAPSGANHQPWHFVAICDPAMKARIRAAAEAEEERFYEGGAGEEWLKALEPMGTAASKPHLTTAPWLVVVFAQRYGLTEEGERYKNYYVPESVGIATGFLIAALHRAGLSCLTHTPNPMRFLNDLCGRPDHEKPVMILVVGHPAGDATVPRAAKIKKPLDEILTICPDGDA